MNSPMWSLVLGAAFGVVMTGLLAYVFFRQARREEREEHQRKR